MRKSVCSLLIGLATACSGGQDNRREPAAAGPAAAQATAASNAAGGAAPEKIEAQPVAAEQVPVAQRLPGKLTQGWRWTDANGENLLVLYTVGPLPDEPEKQAGVPDEQLPEEQYLRLLGRQYVKQPGGTYAELWRLMDEVRHCPFDLGLTLVPGATAITDLDHDGQTETTLMYRLACRSDVSEDPLKLIMREGRAKYALRGYSVVQVDSLPARLRRPPEPCCLDKLSEKEREQAFENATHAGRYASEAEFRAVPAFLRFARRHWQQFSVQESGAVE